MVDSNKAENVVLNMTGSCSLHEVSPNYTITSNFKRCAEILMDIRDNKFQFICSFCKYRSFYFRKITEHLVKYHLKYFEDQGIPSEIDNYPEEEIGMNNNRNKKIFSMPVEEILKQHAPVDDNDTDCMKLNADKRKNKLNGMPDGTKVRAKRYSRKLKHYMTPTRSLSRVHDLVSESETSESRDSSITEIIKQFTDEPEIQRGALREVIKWDNKNAIGDGNPNTSTDSKVINSNMSSPTSKSKILKTFDSKITKTFDSKIAKSLDSRIPKAFDVKTSKTSFAKILKTSDSKLSKTNDPIILNQSDSKIPKPTDLKKTKVAKPKQSEFKVIRPWVGANREVNSSDSDEFITKVCTQQRPHLHQAKATQKDISTWSPDFQYEESKLQMLYHKSAKNLVLKKSSKQISIHEQLLLEKSKEALLKSMDLKAMKSKTLFTKSKKLTALTANKNQKKKYKQTLTHRQLHNKTDEFSGGIYGKVMNNNQSPIPLDNALVNKFDDKDSSSSSGTGSVLDDIRDALLF